MKKKALSLALVLVMTLTLLPASVLATAAEGAYQVLFEPQLDGAVIVEGGGGNSSLLAYDDTIMVYSVTDRVYRLVRFTGSGMENIPKESRDRSCFHIGADYVVFREDGYSGVMNKQGEVVINPIYNTMKKPDDNGVAAAIGYENGDRYYYLLDIKNQRVDIATEDAYDNFGMNGYSWGGENGFSLVDASGTEILSSEGKDYYFPQRLEELGDGLIPVSQSGMGTGFINLKGEIVIPMQYKSVGHFHNGYAVVYNEFYDAALIDTSGNIVIPFKEYRYFSEVSPGGLVWAYNGDSASLLKVGGSASVTPTQPAGTQAQPTNDSLTCDGEAQNPTVYKIGDSNYFKIRDLAAILDGTEKQFEVGYDGESRSVTAATGQAYTPVGGELAGAPAGAETAEISNDAIYVNGEKVEAEVYKINGNNYFKLRDLGKALNFYVGWTQETGMFIETDKPYSE